MADVTITISTPQLVGLEKFKVRYREYPNGAWSSYQDETNSPFTLTGLTAGPYELEVIVVKVDGSECPATYKLFDVVEEPDCLDFAAEIVQSGSLYYLQISYTVPSPYTPPTCGYKITYGSTTVNYASLPASPILIPVPNASIGLSIVSDDCNGNEVSCFDQDIPPIDEMCTPMVIGSVTAAVTSTYPNGFKAIAITFPYTQSTPATKFITFTVTQKNVMSGLPAVANYPNFSFGPIPVSGSPTIVQNLAANNNVPTVFDSGVDKKQYVFDWLIVDACNNTHTGTVTLLV